MTRTSRGALLCIVSCLLVACGDGGGDGDGDGGPIIGVCGDGAIEGLELCDDGNQTDGDGCDSNCRPTGCGNGIQTAGEECDDGNTVEGDGCDSNCTPTACGNGVVSSGEECDDGNTIEDDGCDSSCSLTCGNGILEGDEQCDDGNTVDGDGCDSNCTLTACGNGIITSPETCDDGNSISDDGCDANCQPSGCGNGVKSTREQCDDGNTISGDGCDVNCTITACGNCVVNQDESCDDGNATNGDGCDVNCTVSACGNGAVDPATEECDDGNTLALDGCDDDCRLETCGDGAVNTRTGLVSFRVVGRPLTSVSFDLIVNGAFFIDDGFLSSTSCTSTSTSATVEDADLLGALAGSGNTFRLLFSGPVGSGAIEAELGFDLDQDGDADHVERIALVTDDDCDAPGCCLDTVQVLEGTFDLPAEECDDGADGDPLDGCTDACEESARCGDGIVEFPEECDDGNTLDGDGCDTTCTDTGCGNGIVTDGEQCDDGGTCDGDSSIACAADAECFDGEAYVGPCEARDSDGCDASCSIETGWRCPVMGASNDGDGGVFMGMDASVPDGGFSLVGSTSGGMCTPICGDGVEQSIPSRYQGVVFDCEPSVQGTESCSPSCTPLGCGSGVVDGSEECDDGNTSNEDACTNLCVEATCGDGFQRQDDPSTPSVDESEACDDGNTIDGDGCDSNCRPTGCGNGVVTGQEVCDDGTQCMGGANDGMSCTNALDCPDGSCVAFHDDGCGNDCQPNLCGDGTVTLQEVCFRPPLSLEALDGPVAIDAARVDAGSTLDLVTANGGAETFSVWLNDGSGVGLSPVEYHVGVSAQVVDVVSRDFAGTGFADVAVLERNAGYVQVRYNNGDGTFCPGATLSVGEQPERLRAADLDGDGDDDLIVPNRGSDNVSVLLNQGIAGFGIAVGYTACDQPSSAAAGDIDADGNADIVVTCEGDDALAVLLGDGNGTFGPPTIVSTDLGSGVGNNPTAVEILDLNGDRADDLVVGFGGGSVEVLIYTNDADPEEEVAFRSPSQIDGAPKVRSMLTRDLDGDSDRDILILGNGGELAFLANNGSGAFLPPNDGFFAGDGATDVVAGDLTGDGVTDLASSAGGAVNVMTSNP